MQRGWVAIGIVLSLAIAVGQSPQINSLSASSLPRSGRLRIFGANFGTPSTNSYVSIGGVRCWTTRWTSTAITAYVPESLPLGAHPVQVVTPAGASNTVNLQVTARARQGRVLWRFQADDDYIHHRPAVASDGTIIVHDSGGYVYALSPDGGLKWIYEAGYPYGPPSVGADGTVYVGTGAIVKALNLANGTLRWQFADTTSGALWIVAGPTVGPDGNVYVVTNTSSSGGGLGVFSLTPTGQLRWNNRGNPLVLEYGSVGVEIVFGASRAGRAVDQLYVTFDVPQRLYAFQLTGGQRWAVSSGAHSEGMMQPQCQPAVGPDGTVYLTTFSALLSAFNPENGAVRWRYTPPVGNVVSPPDVGSDGVIYFAHALGYLSAVNPNGTLRWSVSDGSILQYPTVSPNNTMIVTGGGPSFGVPGFVRGYSTQNGQLLWQVDLGSENGGNQVLDSRPRFSRDGRTVYFGTALPGQNSQEPYCYLYAVYADSWVQGDVDGNGCVDDADLLMVLFAFGCSSGCGAEDVNSDGVVDDADLLTVLFAFGSGC
jgi:outer membrane protein assembly factor BamB